MKIKEAVVKEYGEKAWKLWCLCVVLSFLVGSVAGAVYLDAQGKINTLRQEKDEAEGTYNQILWWSHTVNQNRCCTVSGRGMAGIGMDYDCSHLLSNETATKEKFDVRDTAIYR